MDTQTIEANRRQQAELYGRPLGEIVRELTAALHLSQGRLAEVLGMSAPMVSQLASGHRVKMGNPQAVARLQALIELAPMVPHMPPEQVTGRLEEIAQRSTTITQAAPAQSLVDGLRALAPKQALLGAAAGAAPHSAVLADMLRRAAEDPRRA